MNKYFVAAALAASVSLALRANTESIPAGIGARIWGVGQIASGQSGYFSLSGTFLHTSPATGGETQWSASTSTTNGGAVTTDLGSSNNGLVRVEPNKVYVLNCGGQNLQSAEINIIAPPGYTVFIDDVPRTRSTFIDVGWTYWFQIKRDGEGAPVLAGTSSEFDEAGIALRIGLGTLRNGTSAGALELVDAGTRSDWADLFTPKLVSYNSRADEIWVYRTSGDVLRQIGANQAFVDIVTTSSTAYEIRFYHPDTTTVNYSNTPRTFTGSPFVVYKVQQGSTSKTLKIIKEVRDVTSPGQTISTATRVEETTIARTGTWPGYTWTRSPWNHTHTNGTATNATPISETTAVASGSSGARTGETIGTHPVGGTNAVVVDRAYSFVSGLGELVSSETVGTSTNLITSYDYYTSTSNPGTYGLPKSTTVPGGGWTATEYYDPTSSTSTRAAMPKYIFRPYGNSPTTPSFTSSSGEVVYFEYANDAYGAQRNPSLIQTSVNGTAVAKSTFSYSYEVRYGNSQVIDRITRTDFANATTSLQTVMCVYRGDGGDAFYRGQPFMITTPDGVRRVFAHRKGTWNSSTKTFTAASGNPGTGTASRISAITGTTSSSGNTLIQTYGGADIDDVYLVAGKSIIEHTFRDERGLVVRTEAGMWSGSTWVQTGYVDFTYDMQGRLTSRVSSNGDATYSASYSGGMKTSETNEQGVVTQYAYDSGRRIDTLTRVGSGVIGTLVTKFTYNAANRVTEERVGYGQSEQIVTTAQYDNAGRVTSQTPPGLSATTHSYDVTNRAHTITQPGSRTIINTFSRDGRIASRTGTAVVHERYTYGVETDGRRWQQVALAQSNSARTNKRWADWAGRKIKNERPGFGGSGTHLEEWFYDSGGHLQKSTKTGRNPILYTYNTMGQLHRTGLDVDNNGALDLASNDRITEFNSYLESYNSAYWLRTDTKGYAQANNSTYFDAGSRRVRLTGHPGNRLGESQTIDAEGNVTTSLFIVDRTNKTSESQQTRSGITGTAKTTFVNGLPRQTIAFTGLTTTTGYDGLLRANTTTDSRNNATTTAFVSGTRRPSTVTDASTAQNAFGYESGTGRLAWRRDQKNFYTRFTYNDRNQVLREWGDGAMPVEYVYDSFGARTHMKTFRGGTGWDGTSWPASPGTADTTEWIFDAYTGFLSSKKDAANRSVSYTYCTCGKVASETWARGVSKTYGYSSTTGELLTIDYSDSTPDITYAYTRLGQLDSVSGGASGTHDFVYDSSKPWRLSAEAFDTFYNQRVMTRLYESSGVAGRGRGFQLGSTAGSNADIENTFGYTAAGRFEAVTAGWNSNASTRTFRYGYLTNSDMVETMTIDGGHAFSVDRDFDASRNLVTDVETLWSSTSRVRYSYGYDERRNRTSALQAGDVFNDYGNSTFRRYTYNGRNELTEDVGYLGTDVNALTAQLPGRFHKYDHDNAGNRNWSSRTGDSAIKDEYQANALNQYTTRENNTLPISGTANTDSNVAAKGVSTAAGRQGRYWNDEVVVNNEFRPWRGTLSIYTGKNGSPSNLYRLDTYTTWLAQALQSFTYDHDGNLTSDGVWDYSWDAENRLVAMETTLLAADSGFPKRRLEFKYDYRHRRVQKRVLDWVSGAWSETSCRRFAYDGDNLVAEYATSGSTIGSLVRSYTWGLDIASSRRRTAGVGALTQITDHGSGKTYLPAHDANGNVVGLFNGATGSVCATYEYSAYGDALRNSCGDSTIADQPIRFSSKFTDVETGMVNYGRRYYDSKCGRFINRDPIGERGGRNLHSIVRNNPVNRRDRLGLADDEQLVQDADGSGGASEETVVLPTVYVTADPLPELPWLPPIEYEPISFEPPTIEVDIPPTLLVSCQDASILLAAARNRWSAANAKATAGAEGLLREMKSGSVKDSLARALDTVFQQQGALPGTDSATVVDRILDAVSLAPGIPGEIAPIVNVLQTNWSFYSDGSMAVANGLQGDALGSAVNATKFLGSATLNFAELAGVAGRANAVVAVAGIVMTVTEFGVHFFLNEASRNEGISFFGNMMIEGYNELKQAESDINQWQDFLESNGCPPS